MQERQIHPSRRARLAVALGSLLELRIPPETISRLTEGAGRVLRIRFHQTLRASLGLDCCTLHLTREEQGIQHHTGITSMTRPLHQTLHRCSREARAQRHLLLNLPGFQIIEMPPLTRQIPPQFLLLLQQKPDPNSLGLRPPLIIPVNHRRQEECQHDTHQPGHAPRRIGIGFHERNQTRLSGT